MRQVKEAKIKCRPNGGSDGILFTGNLLFDDLVQFALGITA